MLKQFSIGVKVTAISIIWLVFLSIVMGISINSFNHMDHAATELRTTANEIREVEEFEKIIVQTNLVAMEIIINRETGKVDSEFLQKLEAFERHVRELEKHLEKTVTTEKEKKLAQHALESYENYYHYIKDVLVRAVENKVSNKEFMKIDQQIDELSKPPMHDLEELLKAFDVHIKEAIQEEHDAYSKLYVMIFVSVFAMLLGGFASFFVVRSVMLDIGTLAKNFQRISSDIQNGKIDSRVDPDEVGSDFKGVVTGANGILKAFRDPIKEVMGVMKSLANKDLTDRVKGDYRGDLLEFKNNVNAAGENLMTAITQVGSSAQKVDDGSKQIADAAQNLAEGSTEQASSMEEITSTMNEFGAQTRKNSENANEAQNISDEAQKSAESGNVHMKRMLQSMQEITQSSDDIAKIIKVIDEIAFQTNLLALNAAVEAARAGKYGKGFAVVAEEVRNLAKRSAQAAKETTQIIEESGKKVGQGAEIAEMTAKSLEEISEFSIKVMDLINEIATASEGQAKGISEVITAMAQIEQVTQRNTGSAEESASASRELSSLSRKLNELVRQFRY